jgi:hypothetical protein
MVSSVVCLQAEALRNCQILDTLLDYKSIFVDECPCLELRLTIPTDHAPILASLSFLLSWCRDLEVNICSATVGRHYPFS